MPIDSVWVAGEALIDLVATNQSPKPLVGGAAANTAKALAKLGVKTHLIGGISFDNYGQLISRELESFGVDLSLVYNSNKPTAIAETFIDERGNASYSFQLEDTATFSFFKFLPVGKPSILHIGSLATILEPGASNLLIWAHDLGVPIVFDPNVRDSVLYNKEVYRSYFKRWARISKYIKASDEDLNFLEIDVEEILDLGVEAVVITKGAKGLSGIRKNYKIDVPALEIDVIDTIGAGDTVGAVVTAEILKYQNLNKENLETVLRRCAIAAALTCNKLGASPPDLAEITLIEKHLDSR